MQQTKRHHYVPKAYLKAFCDPTGRLLVYRKDQPGKVLPMTPDATQFRRYYYSQPMPNGGQDNNQLEAFFSSIEGKWPPVVTSLRKRGEVSVQLMTDIFEFMALQFARVPARRDLVEASLAQTVKTQLKALDARGELPPPPSELPNILEEVVVAIDPHQSIHAMATVMRGMGELFNHIGLVVIHNGTPTPFLSSDNPVIWFDPSLPFDKQLPYTVNLDGGDICFFFPVSPTMAILGTREQSASYSQNGLTHQEAPHEEWVKAMNTQISRFAYEAVIACSPSQEDVVRQFADASPVLESTTIPTASGFISVSRQVFGKRTTKPKWEGLENS
ncbi:DUF4238 domain-containing protein [Aquabacterium soli]|uniref:DUF4238 domain-containing protein n=1 Tax=Aquabacterium soli TaxID=2493092 RepID=A0A426UZB6_9BURK|nr:DUF4238 domain-containing protein [Aquabacterium soli]RRR99925.1 DUF4238 domain-containing protein [Aquabacterium soli]